MINIIKHCLLLKWVKGEPDVGFIFLSILLVNAWMAYE